MTKPASVTRYRNFFIFMGILCLAAIVVNLVVRRGPVHDANAVEDIRSISGSVDGYFSGKAALPASLNDIKSSLSPATRERIGNYEYTPTSLNQYRLCATFATAGTSNIAAPVPASGNPDPSQHAQGRQCFDYMVNVFSPGAPKPL